MSAESTLPEAEGKTKTIKVRLSSAAPMGGCSVGLGNDLGTAMPGAPGLGLVISFINLGAARKTSFFSRIRAKNRGPFLLPFWRSEIVRLASVNCTAFSRGQP